MEPLVNTIIATVSTTAHAESAALEAMNTNKDEEIREIYEEYSRQLELRLREFSGSRLQ